jgi:DNA invertase Pin-like site-specific DNA recombinase
MESMKYGYARVSTNDQTPALQLAALKKAGCKTVFKDEGAPGHGEPVGRVARLCQ